MPYSHFVVSIRLRNYATIKDLSYALKNYENEYGHFPLEEPIRNDMDTFLDTSDSRFVTSLLGIVSPDNIRGITFVDFPLAKDRRGGLLKENGSYQLVDPYGYPYHVIIDTNRDYQVWNPDSKNSGSEIRSGAAKWLPERIAIFSGGADGVDFTSDDSTSWREMPGPSFIDELRAIVILATGPIFLIIGLLGVWLAQSSGKKLPVQSSNSP